MHPATGESPKANRHFGFPHASFPEDLLYCTGCPVLNTTAVTTMTCLNMEAVSIKA